MSRYARLLDLEPNELDSLLLRLLTDEVRRQRDWRRCSDGFGTFG